MSEEVLLALKIDEDPFVRLSSASRNHETPCHAAHAGHAGHARFA